MIRSTHFVAALAFGVGLSGASVALAQTQTGGAAAPSRATQSAPPPAGSLPPPVKVELPALKPWSPNATGPTYSIAQPEGSSGIYLPAVVLGYAKSATLCVTLGCEDGPQVGGSSGASPTGSTEPAVAPSPANPRNAGPGQHGVSGAR